MSEFDLSEWWAVLVQGEWFCGKRAGNKLSSLNKINMPFSVQPVGGGIAPRTDVLVYPWFLDSLVIPEGAALWISLDAMPNAAPWAKIIMASESLKLEQRAQRSGIHLARH
jgi:hypothetical protein